MTARARSQGRKPSAAQSRAAQHASDGILRDMAYRKGPEPEWAKDPSRLPKKPPGRAP